MADVQSNQNVTLDPALDMSMSDFGERKVFSIALDSLILESDKFVNAMAAYEALMDEELKKHEVEVQEGTTVVKYPYEQYLEVEKVKIQKLFPNVDQWRERDMHLAFKKLKIIHNIQRHKEPVKILYEIKPGRADLIAPVRLRQLADKILNSKGTATIEEVRDEILLYAEDLEKELIKTHKEEFDDTEVQSEE